MKREWFAALLTATSFFASLSSFASPVASLLHMCTIGGLTIVGLSLCKDLNRDVSILLTGLFVTILVSVSNLVLTSQPEAILMGLTLALQVMLCWGFATILSFFSEVKVLDQICWKFGNRLSKAKKDT